MLDLTRVIAGPVCGRTLAAHGADVLLVTAAHLPAIAPLVIDTGRGKLSTAIDLRAPDGRERLAGLVREADVVVQGYRPGGIAALGFGPAEAARLRPGIVYVSLSAYGHVGPWAGRRGFDSLVQTASGFNAAEAAAAGTPDRPKPLPCQILDHASGYLMAFGAIAGLIRRHERRRQLARPCVARRHRPLALRARTHWTVSARPIPTSPTCRIGSRSRRRASDACSPFATPRCSAATRRAGSVPPYRSGRIAPEWPAR